MCIFLHIFMRNCSVRRELARRHVDRTARCAKDSGAGVFDDDEENMEEQVAEVFRDSL